MKVLWTWMLLSAMAMGQSAPPPTVKVRSFTTIWSYDKWQLKEMVPGEYVGYAGMTNCRKHIILWRRTPMVGVHEVIIHELMHAATCGPDGHSHNLNWNSTTNDEHEGIWLMGEFFANLLSDNPDLAMWLGGK